MRGQEKEEEDEDEKLVQSFFGWTINVVCYINIGLSLNMRKNINARHYT